jgi:hypothetical protein
MSMARRGIALALLIAATLIAGAPASRAASAPTVSSVYPDTGQGAVHRAVKVQGANFVLGAALSFPGDGVSVESTTFVSATRLTAIIDVAVDAPTGIRGATVTNPDGSAGTCEACFMVDPGPSPASVSPSAGAQGETLSVAVLGSAFQDPAKVRFGAGIRVLAVSYAGSGQLDATISISPLAALGARDVTVLNATDQGRGTCPGCFAVTSGFPGDA